MHIAFLGGIILLWQHPSICNGVYSGAHFFGFADVEHPVKKTDEIHDDLFVRGVVCSATVFYQKYT